MSLEWDPWGAPEVLRIGFRGAGFISFSELQMLNTHRRPSLTEALARETAVGRGSCLLYLMKSICIRKN